MVEIPYQFKPYPFLEIGNAPEGKLSFIEDGDEVWQLGQAELSALSDFLADKPHFMGERPSTASACGRATTATSRAARSHF